MARFEDGGCKADWEPLKFYKVTNWTHAKRSARGLMVPFLHTLYPTFPPIAPSHSFSFFSSFFTLNSSPLSLSHLVPLSLSTFFLQSTTANFPRSPLLHYSPYRPHSRKQFPLTRKNYLQYVPILLPKEPARLSFPSTGLYQTLPS